MGIFQTALEGVRLGRGFDGNPLEFSELIDNRATVEATIAALLCATIRRLEFVLHRRALDVDAASVNLTCDGVFIPFTRHRIKTGVAGQGFGPLVFGASDQGASGGRDYLPLRHESHRFAARGPTGQVARALPQFFRWKSDRRSRPEPGSSFRSQARQRRWLGEYRA